MRFRKTDIHLDIGRETIETIFQNIGNGDKTKVRVKYRSLAIARYALALEKDEMSALPFLTWDLEHEGQEINLLNLSSKKDILKNFIDCYQYRLKRIYEHI